MLVLRRIRVLNYFGGFLNAYNAFLAAYYGVYRYSLGAKFRCWVWVLNMKLWIMRHGEANPMVDVDANRTLTSWGRAEARSSAEEVLRKGEPPEVLLVSPYRRAQQTAIEVHSVMPEARLETVECLTPETSQELIVAYLDEIPETSIMLVSHEPLVSLLVDFLSGQQISMRTACVAFIESEYWSRKQGDLKWVI